MSGCKEDGKKNSEENVRKRARWEETEDEIEIDHLETGEEMVADTLEEVQKRMLDIYEEQICERDL